MKTKNFYVNPFIAKSTTSDQKSANRISASKTEMLYEKARMALKSKKTKDVVKDASKPPLQRRKSEAVLEVVRKQQKIRRNFENKGSFCQGSSRNSKSNLFDKTRKTMRLSQDKLSSQRMGSRKSQSSLKSDEPDVLQHKVKPSKITRKEARARIGLGEIPDDKIEKLIKVKKNKLKVSKDEPDTTEPEKNKTTSVFQYQKSRSRLSNDERISTKKSTESLKESKAPIRETLKIKFPEARTVERLNIQTIGTKFEPDVNSSINDIGQLDYNNFGAKFPNESQFDNEEDEDFTPIYNENRKHKKTSAGKLKNSKTGKLKDTEKDQEEAQMTEQERYYDNEAKKELVKQQKRAQAKRMKEEKEQQMLKELKKKQNLESLNDMLKKRTENYKKKQIDNKNTPNDPFNFDEENKEEALNRLTAQPVNQSQDNFKVQHFVGPKLPVRHKTTKNSTVTSVTHSIQSPLSRQSMQEFKKRPSFSDDSTKASHVQNFQSRRTYNPKINKKSIKKVINIPSVKIDKKLVKAQRTAMMGGNLPHQTLYDGMDVIPENQDTSEIDTMSVHTKTVSNQEKKAKKSENSSRKVVISKISKYTKDSNKKPVKGSKVKGKKIKKRSNVENANHSINMNITNNSIAQDNYVNKSYQHDYSQEELFKSASAVKGKKIQKVPVQQINPEIEYAPKPDIQSSTPKDWENIEMFSSKKFSDILKKHKKVIRYHDSEINEEESYIDAQSKDQLHITDFDDSQDYANPKSGNQNDFKNHQFTTFDRIRKSKPSQKESGYKGELKIEELTSSIKKSAKRRNLEDFEPSGSKMSENKVFTTSINLLDYDLLSAEKQYYDEPSRTQDCREDSLEKQPNWNFAGVEKDGFFEGTVTSKKVIVDDLEEFQYDDEEPFEHTGESGAEIHENVSVIENENDLENDNIPFNVDDEEIYSHNNDEIFSHNDDDEIFSHNEDDDQNEQSVNQADGENTLKQMRMLFGSEQKIREQSEAAIKHFNEDDELSNENQSEDEDFKTPGLSQSQSINDKNATAKSNVFNRQSFQEFSMKKFQEIMFDNNISDFMNSVERTVRANTIENSNSKVKQYEGNDKKSLTPKRKAAFNSPRKFSRKELELDRIVGSKMKFMSEKKKRHSMLENYDSNLSKEITQNPLNKSFEVYKAKFANYNTENQGVRKSVNEQFVNSENNIVDKTSQLALKGKKFLFKIIDYHKNVIEIERTDQVFIKNKLTISAENDYTDPADLSSIKRSNVRGLEILISEKSQENDIKENQSLKSKPNQSDDNKTLKYGTEERSELSDNKSKISQKDEMYGKLEKIMTN